MLRRSSTHSGRLVCFETLESRSLLAGNVMVAVNSGELDITGDNANNSIQVTQLTSGQWKVTGIATKINNGSSPFITDSADPVTGNIQIQLSGGSDTVNVSHGTVPGALLIDADDNPPTMFDGNDIVQVSNITTGLDTLGTGQSLHIVLGKGNNIATVTGCTTSGSTEIDSDTGNSQFVMSNDTINGGDSAFNGIFPGQGSSVISLSNVKWTAGDNGLNEIDLLLPGKSTISLSNVSMTVGNGGLNGVLTHGPQTTIALTNVTMTGGIQSDNTINPGPGTSTISLVNVSMTTGDNNDGNRIVAGSGKALISMSHVNMHAGSQTGNLVHTQDGTSTIIMSKVQMTCVIDCGNDVTTGNGNSTIVMSGVTMSTQGFGGNTVQSGDGKAVLTLANINMSCGADGGNIITTGNSNAVISLVNSSLMANGTPSSNEIQTGAGNDVVSLVRVNATGDLAISTGDGTDAVSLNSVNVGPSDLSVDVGPGNYDSLAVVNCTAGTEELSDTGGTNGTIVGAANHFAAPPTVSGFRYRIGI